MIFASTQVHWFSEDARHKRGIDTQDRGVPRGCNTLRADKDNKYSMQLKKEDMVSHFEHFHTFSQAKEAIGIKKKIAIIKSSVLYA